MARRPSKTQEEALQSEFRWISSREDFVANVKMWMDLKNPNGIADEWIGKVKSGELDLRRAVGMCVLLGKLMADKVICGVDNAKAKHA